jgi:hypothetical protein
MSKNTEAQSRYKTKMRELGYHQTVVWTDNDGNLFNLIKLPKSARALNKRKLSGELRKLLAGIDAPGRCAIYAQLAAYARHLVHYIGKVQPTPGKKIGDDSTGNLFGDVD